MAIVFGGKHFGQYTYEHWFDDEVELEADELNLMPTLKDDVFDESAKNDHSG